MVPTGLPRKMDRISFGRQKQASDYSKYFYHAPVQIEKLLNKVNNSEPEVNHFSGNGSCRFYSIYIETPEFAAITAPILVCLFLIFSTIPIAVFTKKKLRCPSSILLTGIAISDVMFAVCLYLCTPYLYFNYKDAPLTYPLCVIVGFLQFTAFTFHSVSVTITTILGVQKVSAVIFPFRSRLFYTKRTSFICVIVVNIACFAIFTPVFLTRNYFASRDIDCLYDGSSTCVINVPWESPSSMNREIHLYFHMVKCVAFEIVPCVITLVTTLFLTLTLNKYKNPRQTVHSISVEIPSTKRLIRCHVSAKYEAKQRRSSFLIILVLVIFLTAESPNIVLSYIEYHSWFHQTEIIDYETKWTVNQIHNFILLLKVICDMAIYVSISRHFRTEIKSMLSKMFQCKCNIGCDRHAQMLTYQSSNARTSKTIVIK